MRLRVAIDDGILRVSQGGAVRALEALAAAVGARGDVELVRVGGGPAIARGAAGRHAAVLRLDLAWHPVGARRAARAAAADVLHCPVPRGPLRPGRPPAVVMVHDAVHLRAPETMSAWNRRVTAATFARVVGSAVRVVVPSEDGARDLVERAGVARERIVVAPEGVDARFRGTPAAPSPIAGPFALFVGTVEPRKNLARLAAAAARADLPLVVAGAPGWGDGRPDAPGVRFLGRVDDATLHALYASASCLAIPSLHEGFGLPAAEAMACGTPVVAAARGALPEVCGDAAVLVDPLDVADIARGLEEAIARRAELVPRGRTRAATLTWAAHAEAVVGAWRDAAG